MHFKWYQACIKGKLQYTRAIQFGILVQSRTALICIQILISTYFYQDTAKPQPLGGLLGYKDILECTTFE